jgi:hypothetical protein
LNPLGGEPVDGVDKSPTCPLRPQENKSKKKWTFDVLLKPAKLIRDRHETMNLRGSDPIRNLSPDGTGTYPINIRLGRQTGRPSIHAPWPQR